MIAYDRNKLLANFDGLQGRNNRPPDDVDLDLWVGHWTFDAEFRPTFDDPGRKVSGVADSRRVLHDHFVLTNSRSNTDDTEFVTFLTRDVNSSQYRLWVFGSRGEAYERQGNWNAAERKLALDVLPPTPGVTGTSTDQFIGDNRLESTLLVRAADGRLTRDVHSLWRRAGAAQNVEIKPVSGRAGEPVELSQLDKFAGRWTVQVKGRPSVWEPSGRELSATEIDEWILGGKFLLVRGYDEKNDLNSMMLATYEPAEKSSRFWFFGADGSSGQWRVTWDAASRGYHWRSIDMPVGWIGTAFSRWIDDDTFDNQMLIKDEIGRVLIDSTHYKRRIKP